MAEETGMRHVVEREIREFQGYLFFAEIQGLKRGDYAGVARTLLKRVRYCFTGLVIFAVFCGQMALVPTPPELVGWKVWGERLGSVLAIGFWLAVLVWLVYKWGRLSGSMHTVLALLEEERTEDPPAPGGRAPPSNPGA